MVGAKFDTVFRILLLKYTVFRRPFNVVATVYVVHAQTRVNNAFVKVDTGDTNVLPISDAASTTKMQLISTEKISSVNRVKYFTKLEPDVTADRNRIADVHNPVHAYNGKNGRFI